MTSTPSDLPGPIPVHRMTRTSCTKCGWRINAAGDPADTRAKPKPGDLGVCLECGHVMIYTRGGRLRDLTEHELGEIAADADLSLDLARRTELVGRVIRELVDRELKQ